jgi:hypothetical protein
MNAMRKVAFFGLSVFWMAGAGLADPKVARAEPDVSKASSMSRSAVRSLFRGKTWLWNDGAGYFLENGRFRAYSGSGKDEAYGVGSWYAASGGRLCFTAVWRTAVGKARKTDCFEHRGSTSTKGLTVFQRRLPDGVWYAFKTATALTGEASPKLVQGRENWSTYRQVRNRILKLRQRRRR